MTPFAPAARRPRSPSALGPALVAAVIYLLSDTDAALAWGPGMHVSLADEILRNVAWLPAAVGAIITRYARDYLYGNLAADVVFAKRLSKVKQFCHHWTTGFEILERAADDSGRAFAYGYLSHLAADTVAHGKFVPHQVAISRGSVNFGHLYWEMRADAAVGPPAWCLVDELMAGRYPEHHRILADLLKRTFLPFDANRLVFRRINLLVGRRSWQRTMVAWERRSRHSLPAGLLAQYRAECLERIVCLLTHQRRSPLLVEDPNGTAALSQLRVHRRDVRRLERWGLAPHLRITEEAAAYAPGSWQPVAHAIANGPEEPRAI